MSPLARFGAQATPTPSNVRPTTGVSWHIVGVGRPCQSQEQVATYCVRDTRCGDRMFDGPWQWRLFGRCKSTVVFVGNVVPGGNELHLPSPLYKERRELEIFDVSRTAFERREMFEAFDYSCFAIHASIEWARATTRVE